MIFTIFMCRRRELDYSCSINRTTSSHKGKRQRQRQGRTMEERVDQCYFMTESNQVF